MSTKPSTASKSSVSIKSSLGAPKLAPPMMPDAPKAVASTPDAPKAPKVKRARPPLVVHLGKSVTRLEKRASRIAPMFSDDPTIMLALREAVQLLQRTAEAIDLLPETWKPAKRAGGGLGATREPLSNDMTVRISKGLVSRYVALLEDETEDALSLLTLKRVGEKHSLVTTPSGITFAISTKHLRRV